MESGTSFPYEEFARWLKDAMTAGQIVNKLTDAVELEQPVYMTVDEHDLLVAVRQKVPGQYPTLEMLAMLSLPAVYPIGSQDQIQVVWNLLTAHITSDGRYAPLRNSLMAFLNAHPTGELLLANMVGCFGPALAPIESWGCTLP